MQRISLAIFCILFSSLGLAGYDEDVATINNGMPKSVQQLNKRQIECNHWGGEEPYDKRDKKKLMQRVRSMNVKS